MAMPRWALIAAIALAALADSGSAAGSWDSAGSGSAYSGAQTMAAGNAPTASVSGRNVSLSWQAPGGAVPVDGYTVKRHATGGGVQTIGANCSGTVTGLTCTESHVPSGSWQYTVMPLHDNWQGSESARSSSVTVGTATLSLDSSSVSSLPATVTGQVTNFNDGQTVTFRLDNPTTGTVLSGSITPSPVPSNGTASVSVTIPSGTSNGSHTVYAIGSGSDTASAALSVAVPTNIATSAWDVRDASSGAESNRSDVGAFANDGRTASYSFGISFNTSRYLQFDLNSSLQPGKSVSGVNFNFNFSAGGLLDTACFYFDVRRISTGNVIGTHGSSGSPVDCRSGTSLLATSTALPEVTTSDIANDLRVRVFLHNGLLGGVTRDLSTVSGTVSGDAFTLYDAVTTDASSGTATASPWGLAASGDGAFYQSTNNWQSAFSGSRYLKLVFPSYVPSNSTMDGVSFKHAYRSATSGTTCYYFEVYDGATLIGTHGSSGSPVSCNSSTSTYVTDSVSLPEIDTVAEANNATIKIYASNSAGTRSQHDLAELSIAYID